MNTKELIYFHEQVFCAIRKFFNDRKFHELQTPLLYRSVPTEATIKHLETTWRRKKTKSKLYLSSSPEKGLKGALSSGVGNCFAISKSFRDLEDGGSLNLPEFTMLEWYRQDADYEQIMFDVQSLFNTLKNQPDPYSSWPKYSLLSLFKTYTEIDLVKDHADTQFFKKAKQKGYKIEKHTTWEQLFHQIFLNEVYPHLSKKPLLLIDFPARISPLCKPVDNNPLIAQRFELYIEGIEIANGNTENLGAKNEDLEFVESLRAMQKLSSSYSGIGLGVERLMMILTGKKDIKDIVFDQLI